MPGGAPGARKYFAQVFSLALHSLMQLVRSPSHSRRAEAARQWARRSLWAVAIGGVIIAMLMFALDVREIAWMPPRGTAFLWPLRILTDFGKSAYVLWLLAATLLAVLIVAPAIANPRRMLLARFGTRIQFLFLAVLVPNIVGELSKGIVGRGRPFAGGEANAFNFSHFAWSETYASFPSSHAITGFALAFAVSAVWPRMRAAMMVYAVVIAGTRLVLLAHHPSDVIAGALLGAIGAMFVRYWFAARHLVFAIKAEGAIVPLSEPTWESLKSRVARRSLHTGRATPDSGAAI